ncbi:MAG: LamB/YcsF family protein [Desulfitobacteriaceae bacterium]
MRIDLNCDLGESFGSFRVGSDAEILRLVSSANIACGMHAGDFSIMRKTVITALANGVTIGAHPGLPDLHGFGRRWIPYTPDEIYDMLIYQIGALSAVTRVQGGVVSYVKLHGALGHRAVVDRAIAAAVVHAVKDYSPELKLYFFSNSLLMEEGMKAGLRMVSEVFADRNYQADGNLVPRSDPQAIVHSSDEVVARVLDMVTKGTVQSIDGQEVPLVVETICLHGDNEKALTNAIKLRKALDEYGINVKAVGD